MLGECRGSRSMLSPSHVRRVYGIDFSGAKDAGKHIWIATGVVEGKVLRIEKCSRADRFLGSGRGLEQCLSVLREFIASEKSSAFGLDFPFGLPRELLNQGSWEEFIFDFRKRYPSAEEFHSLCHLATDGKERKRLTDREARTPFSPYNRHIYKQTYYGIRDVLRPLVQGGLARVLPMQRPEPGLPWVLEICPASTLKRLGLPDKGRTKAHYDNRTHILEGLEAMQCLSISSSSLRSIVLDDHNGDALDSVIAASATFRVVCNPNRLIPGDMEPYRLEGYVYV